MNSASRTVTLLADDHFGPAVDTLYVELPGEELFRALARLRHVAGRRHGSSGGHSQLAIPFKRGSLNGFVGQLMSIEAARIWMITSSLLMLGLYGVFFILAPLTPYPLTYSQAVQELQVVFPLFIGYLGTAAVSLQNLKSGEKIQQSTKMLSLLVKGPFYLSGMLSVAATTGFGVSNWHIHALPFKGNGMTFETFGTLLTTILSLHVGVTNALVAFTFKRESNNAQDN